MRNKRENVLSSAWGVQPKRSWSWQCQRDRRNHRRRGRRSGERRYRPLCHSPPRSAAKKRSGNSSFLKERKKTNCRRRDGTVTSQLLRTKIITQQPPNKRYYLIFTLTDQTKPNQTKPNHFFTLSLNQTDHNKQKRKSKKIKKKISQSPFVMGVIIRFLNLLDFTVTVMTS